MAARIDRILSNADWAKRRWDLPAKTVAELKRVIAPMTLEHFLTLPAAQAMPDSMKRELGMRDAAHDPKTGEFVSGSTPGAVVSDRVLARVQAQVRAKFAADPKPTAAERAEMRRRYAEDGAEKTESNLRGNSAQRERSCIRLVAEFSSDGGKTCPCVYCGVLLTPDTVTRDRMWPGAIGGRYNFENLAPACPFDNKSRGDTPFEDLL